VAVKRVGILLASATLAAAATGCGTTVVKTVGVTETQTVEAPPPPPEEPPAPPASGSSSQASRVARIGTAIVLHGNDDGEAMKLKLLAVQDPFVPTGEFAMKPEAGQRYVAVKVALTNVGSTVYDDSPSNGTVLIDTADQQYTDEAFEGMKPDIGSPTIASGDRRVGWITMSVAKAAHLKKMQFTLDSGFGPEAGEWLLR
jgi:hypothetical protein